MKRLILLLVTMAALTACARSEPKNYPIVGKHESGDMCYIDIQVEVSPDDYIGLEVGDEFEVRK